MTDTQTSPNRHAGKSVRAQDVNFRPLDVERDVPLVHSWLTHPRSHFWDMQEATRDDVAAGYRRTAESPHEDAWIGEIDGMPIVLVETYDPAHHPLSDPAVGTDVRDGDLGMHLLVAPPEGETRRGLTSAVMEAVVGFCFSRGADRIVVEPDVRNTAVHAKNAEVGFERVADVQLPDKRAAFSVCTRDAFTRACSPTNRAWDEAERLVTAKAIGEFAHELLITPEPLESGAYALRIPASDDRQAVDWYFRARRYALEHWHVDPRSIERRTLDGRIGPASATTLVLDLRDALSLDGDLLTTYLEELSSTVAHRVRTSDPSRPTSADLLDAPAHDVEAAMAEGHPCFVATNGRIGFSADDLAAYSPEAGADVRPLWAAVPKDVSHLSHSDQLDEERAYRLALGDAQYERLQERMREVGVEPSTHRVMPLHPWQWSERVRTTFAEDVARRRIVLLGEDTDNHRACQSIRTWTNVDDPARPYVKTALAVRNMGFVRGLSPAYMRATPAINDYVASIVRHDATLEAAGFDVLTEFAAIGYTGDVFHRENLTGPQTKMIAGLWRESAASRTPEGEQAMTMAALLHRDPHGRAFVTELVEASGLKAREWLRGYLDAYVLPVVHMLSARRLAFIPHGENIILRLRDHRVVGAFLKDIGEEVGLMDDGTSPERVEALPTEIRRIVVEASSADIALGLFTDVFDGFLRFLAPILVEDGLLTEAEFWNEVSDVVATYEREHPEYATSLPLRAPSFARSCLNRLQLRNPLEMVSLDDTVGSLIKTGEIANPIAG